MSSTTTADSASPAKEPSPEPASPTWRKLRIWPAALILALLWASQLLPMLLKDAGPKVFMALFFGPMAAAGLATLWWLFASRARWTERVFGLLGVAAIAAVVLLLAHPTIRGVFVAVIYVLTWGLTAFLAALLLLRAAPPRWRTGGALLAAAMGFGFWDAMRYDGMSGEFKSDLSWRWSPSAEDRYLASLSNTPQTAPPAQPVDADVFASPEWPGFRGPQRDGVIPGVALESDWQAHPPREVWRRLIGPGWSSFAVAGKRLFTQEQRGEQEAVVCLDADTGAELWVYQYESRFFEAVGGAGPRATPTIAHGRIYVLGAMGVLHCLDPLTGEAIWKRDIRTDAVREPPMWGFSSSPLVVGDMVIVHAGGKDDKGVMAYEAHTGEPRWSAPAGDHSYGSPHLATFDGQTLVLMHTNTGLHIFDPEDGKIVCDYAAPFEGYGVLQPLPFEETSVLLGMGMIDGTRRVKLTRDGDQMQAEEQWTSRDLKPGFNDWVAHKGSLYGFDQEIFTCIDLATGKRHWKKGRYGTGQVLLLPEQDQLLIISESGELVLLRAASEKHDELARHKALEGKTWNHHVLVGNRLYARNAEQAVCLELPLTVGPAAALTN